MKDYIDKSQIKYTHYVNGDITVSKDEIDKLPVRHSLDWQPYDKDTKLEDGKYLIIRDTLLGVFIRLVDYAKRIDKIGKYNFPLPEYKGQSGFYYYEPGYGFYVIDNDEVTHYIKVPNLSVK